MREESVSLGDSHGTTRSSLSDLRFHHVGVSRSAELCGTQAGRPGGLGQSPMRRSGIMSGPQTGTRTGPTYTQRASGRIDRLAIWSLVLSILTLGGIGSIDGIWLGLRARTRIDQSGEAAPGPGVPVTTAS